VDVSWANSLEFGEILDWRMVVEDEIQSDHRPIIIILKGNLRAIKAKKRVDE